MKILSKKTQLIQIHLVQKLIIHLSQMQILLKKNQSIHLVIHFLLDQKLIIHLSILTIQMKILVSNLDNQIMMWFWFNDDFYLLENEEDDVKEETAKKTLECGTHLRLSGTSDEVKWISIYLLYYLLWKHFLKNLLKTRLWKANFLICVA